MVRPLCSLITVPLIIVLKKLEIDSFTNYKIYPSKGRLFVRGDSKVSAKTSALV